MNKEQSEELINILREIKNTISKTKEEKINSLNEKLERIRNKLLSDYFTLSLNKSHKKYLEDVFNDKLTFRKQRGL